MLDKAQVANWACSASSRSSGGGIGYGGLSINVSGSSSANACASNESSYLLNVDQKAEIRKASEAIVRAWSSCMEGFGEHVSIKYQDDAHDFTIALRVRKPRGGNDGVARIKPLEPPGSKQPLFTCTTSHTELGKGIRFQNGVSISCRRQDISQPIALDVTYPASGYPGQSLYIPAIQPPPPPHAAAKYWQKFYLHTGDGAALKRQSRRF